MARRAWGTGLAACALLGALVLTCASAWAMAVDVHVTGCADVDPREVERLLGLELAFVASAPALRDALRVDLACSAGRLRIASVDPVTHRSLEREVALGPPEPGRERTIALLASQLFVTSWAESFLQAPEPPAPVAPESPPRAPGGEADHDAAATRDWEVAGGAGLRVRDWSAPALAERAVLGPSLGVGHARLALVLGYERGSVPRAGGSVAWSMMSAGIGGGWRSGRLGPVAVEALATGSVVAVEARGEQARSGFVTSSTHSAVGEVSIAGGPVAFAGPLRVALDAELGATFPAATARDSADRAVVLGGLWAGLTLVVGARGSSW